MSEPGSEVYESQAAARILAWGFLVAFIFLSSVAEGLYRSQAAGPTGRFRLLWTWGITTLLWYWLRAQCAPYRVSFPLDLGFFLFAAWLLVFPHYLWRYQRWRGLAKFGALLTAFALGRGVSTVLPHMISSLS